MKSRDIQLISHFDEGLLVAGCDEAGRGPLAGPVYAASVILPQDFHHPLLNDSKQMSEKNRDILKQIIEDEAVSWSVEALDAQEIDSVNILNASILAMQRAVSKLSVRPNLLLIDGNRFKPFEDYQYKTVVKGDAIYACIAAASVLAKTYRDEHMRKLAQEYPQYAWERNMGYPTKEHLNAIKQYGYTPYHRMSFHPKELEPTLF